MKKKGFGLFVGDIGSGVGLGSFGRGYRAFGPRKPIKSSKDSDFSLDSTKYFRAKYFHFAAGAKDPITSERKAWTYPIYDITHKKLKPQNLKFFFIAIQKTHQGFWGFG